MAAEQTQGHADSHAAMDRKTIWKVFFYLLGLTIVEFIIALYLLPHGFFTRGVANFLYITLTLAKAFYIIAYFMHLKFEKIAFVTGVTISIVFIIYFIVLLLTEGLYLHVHMN